MILAQVDKFTINYCRQSCT